MKIEGNQGSGGAQTNGRPGIETPQLRHFVFLEQHPYLIQMVS